MPAFAAFLDDGLARGDKCLYLSEDPARDQEKLLSLGLPVKKIDFVPLSEWYLSQGHFDAEGSRKNWRAYVEEALGQGYPGVTAVADVGSYFVRRGEIDPFVAYEGTAQDLVPGIKLRVICAYLRPLFPEPYLSQLMGSHQVVAYALSAQELAAWQGDFPRLETSGLGSSASPLLDVDVSFVPSQKGGFIVASTSEGGHTPTPAMARLYRYLLERAFAQKTKAAEQAREVEAYLKAVRSVLATSDADGLDLSAMLDSILKEIVGDLPVEGAWVRILDPTDLDAGLVVEEGLKDVGGYLRSFSQRVVQAGMVTQERDQEVVLADEIVPAALLGLPLRVGYDAGGQVVGAMVLAARDDALGRLWDHELWLRLGVQVGRALEMARLHQESQAHSLRAATVIQASADGIMVVNGQQQVESVNPALKRLLGLEREELVGQRCQHLLGVRLPDGQHICDTVCPFLNPLARGPSTVEVSIQTKEGDQRWAEMAFGPMYDPSGRIAGVVHTIRDITGRKEAERLKDDFIALVSHELRSPLTIIMGMASTLLHKEMALVGLARSGLRDILSQARRLNRLVDNLLVMTASQTGSLGLVREYLRVEKLAAKVIKELKRQSRACSFVLDFPRDFPPAVADPVRLELVLRNLLENAVKYSPDGGAVRVWGRQEDSVLTIGVEDQGMGIPAEHLQDVFQSFYRLQDARVQAKPGVGLGLAVCRRVVEAHGGRLWVRSEPGKGSVFALTLPFLEPSRAL